MRYEEIAKLKKAKNITKLNEFRERENKELSEREKEREKK